MKTPVLVLAAKKASAQGGKGKDAEIAKWEAEVKKSLKSKKTTAQETLSKQDKALVDAQLAKEASIRTRVSTLKHQLERALHLVSSMIASKSDALRSYIIPLATLLLEGALSKGSSLVGSLAFTTYLVSYI